MRANLLIWRRTRRGILMEGRSELRVRTAKCDEWRSEVEDGEMGTTAESRREVCIVRVYSQLSHEYFKTRGFD